jgi:Cell morphogenesis C-terminal
LNQPITREHMAFMFATLQQQVSGRVTGEDYALAVEILQTFRVIVETTPEETLVQFPELFWVAAAMMHSDQEHEYVTALRLLDSGLQRFGVQQGGDGGASPTVHTLYASVPAAGQWQPVFGGLLPLVFKGVTSQFCLQDARRIACGLLGVARGSPSAALAYTDEQLCVVDSLTVLLPDLLHALDTGGDTLAIEADVEVHSAADEAALLAELCAEVQPALCSLLRGYGSSTTAALGAEGYARALAPHFSAAFFPAHDVRVFGLLRELLVNGPPAHQRVLLQFMAALLGEQNSVPPSEQLRTAAFAVFQVVSKFLHTEHWELAVRIMDLVLAHHTENATKPLSFEKVDRSPALTHELGKYAADSLTWRSADKGKLNMYVCLQGLSAKYRADFAELFQGVDHVTAQPGAAYAPAPSRSVPASAATTTTTTTTSSSTSSSTTSAPSSSSLPPRSTEAPPLLTTLPVAATPPSREGGGFGAHRAFRRSVAPAVRGHRRVLMGSRATSPPPSSPVSGSSDPLPPAPTRAAPVPGEGDPLPPPPPPRGQDPLPPPPPVDAHGEEDPLPPPPPAHDDELPSPPPPTLTTPAPPPSLSAPPPSLTTPPQ